MTHLHRVIEVQPSSDDRMPVGKRGSCADELAENVNFSGKVRFIY